MKFSNLLRIALYIVGLPAFTILFLSCRKENALDCFKSNGPDRTETRRPGHFKRIEVFDKTEVTIIQGNDFMVEITAGKNLLKNIRTDVRNEDLIIENINTCNFVRGYKRQVRVRVTVPLVEKITNHGVASVTIEGNFTQDTLVVRAENSGDMRISGTYKQIRTSTHGNGDIYLSGKCNSFYIYTLGSNFVHADNLRVKDYTFVHSLTLGDCTVNATDLFKLECNIQDFGNVYYIGEPQHVTDFSDGKASGQLLKKEK